MRSYGLLVIGWGCFIGVMNYAHSSANSASLALKRELSLAQAQAELVVVVDFIAQVEAKKATLPA
jgi:hypothetical protein